MSSFGKEIGAYQVSHEYTILQVLRAKVTEKEKFVDGKLTMSKTFKEVAKAKVDTLKVQLTTSDLGQQLAFTYQRGGNDEDVKDPLGRILATFTMTKNFELSLVYNTEFTAIDSFVYKPVLTGFPGIEAGSVSEVFSKWLCCNEFFEHLKIVSSKKGYTPALVKMLMLYISYQDVKDQIGTNLGQLTTDTVIDTQEVARVFRANMQDLQNKLPRMAQHYKADLLLAPVAEPAIVTTPDQQTVEVITPDQVETPTEPIEAPAEPIEVAINEEVTEEAPAEPIEAPTEEPTAE